MTDTRKATFGAGCLRGVEVAFRQVPGAMDAVSGSAGGTMAGPSYHDVCTGRTGHAEVVQVTYQYRSAILYHDEERRWDRSGRWQSAIVTEITWRAAICADAGSASGGPD